MNLTKLNNPHTIRFETFMLNPQPVLHGQTSNLKTPGPKIPKDCWPESRRHFNLRQSPDRWRIRLETPPIAPQLGQEKTLPHG